MPKLYTKTGDKGQTSLYDGNRINKSSIFCDVLGNLDLLASNIGMLISLIGENINSICLRKIQVILLNIGSNIAVVYEKRKHRVPKITNEHIILLEGWIDVCEEKNPKLTEFLLTGTNQTDSQCHICRSISRTVERNLWKLNNEYQNEIQSLKYNECTNKYIEPNILKFINRLSDYFFALSRNFSTNEIKVNDIKIF